MLSTDICRSNEADNDSDEHEILYMFCYNSNLDLDLDDVKKESRRNRHVFVFVLQEKIYIFLSHFVEIKLICYIQRKKNINAQQNRRALNRININKKRNEEKEDEVDEEEDWKQTQWKKNLFKKIRKLEAYGHQRKHVIVQLQHLQTNRLQCWRTFVYDNR